MSKKTIRILAFIGVILLVGMYLVTLALAFLSRPSAKGMLMAALACTIVIPCFFYVFMLLARVLDNRASKEEDSENSSSDQRS